MRELERAVVVPVVAGEPVGDRRLRRRGLERGVGVDHAGGRVEPGVRDAPHADPAVVVGHVLEQPVDRVERVGALVDVGGAGLLRPVRPHVDELALRHPAPAHVLVDHDVALGAEERRRAEVRLVGVDAVGLNAVGRPAEHDRVALVVSLGT